VIVEAGVIVQYSNNNGTTWNYNPVDSGDGTDPNVTNIKFFVGTLEDNGANHIVSFGVRIEIPLQNGTIIKNTASMSCSEGVSKDATKDLTVGSSPTLHITKTALNNVQAGDNITYTVEYWNDGTMVATGVVITESYDPNVEFISATPSPDPGTNNQWTVGNLNNNGIHQIISITVKVKTPTPNGTKIDNTVTIDSDQTEPTKSIAETVVGSAPLLTITKTSPQTTVKPGDNIIYTITVGNTGNANATNVIITDTTPINTAFVSARFISKSGTITSPNVGSTGSITFNLSPVLLPNEEFSVEIVVKANFPLDNNATIQNIAHVSCAEDTSGKDSSTVSITIHSSPNLSIDKEGTPNPVQAGENITYTITIVNSGDMNAHNVIITDSTPADTTFVSARFVTGTGTISTPQVGGTGIVNWTPTPPTLQKGESIVVELVVKTSDSLSSGTVVTNTAYVDSEQITHLPSTAQTTVGGTPILTISKTVYPPSGAPGKLIMYAINYSNIGNAPATNILITESLPTEVDFYFANPAPQSKRWEYAYVGGF